MNADEDNSPSRVQGRKRLTPPSIDESLQVLAVLELTLVLPLLLLLPLALRRVELGKVTLVVIESFSVLVEDIGRDGVQERTIVGNDEKGRGPRLKVVFEPADRRH